MISMVASPEQGTELYLVQLRYRKMKITHELLPLSIQGKSLLMIMIVASPEQGTALFLLQLRYRKMRIMQELIPLSIQGKSL